MNKPLTINLSTGNVSTAIPIIADKTQARLRLTSLDVQEKEGGSDSLKFVFELTHPVPDTQGSTIHPGGLGSKVVEFIPLVAKPDAKDPQWNIKKIATRIDALLGTADAGHASKPARPDLNGELVGQLLGKELIAIIKVKTGEYSGNEIATVMFPDDVKA